MNPSPATIQMSVAPRVRPSAWPAAALFFVLALLMNVPYLGMTPLAETEGHRALTGHEMARSGQWLLPMLYGRPYLAKPPLHYWLIATAETMARAAVAHTGSGPAHDWIVAKTEELVGLPNVFVWRMPSALEGGILCAVVCLFAARWFGRTAGVVAGGCTLGMIALWGEHQVTDVDVTNTLCATIAALGGIEILFGRADSAGSAMSTGASCLAASLARRGPSFVRHDSSGPRPASGAAKQEGPPSSIRNDFSNAAESVRDADPTGSPHGNPWPWIILAGLGLGGTLMTKGPAGLPIVAGVWGVAAYQAIRGRRASRLASPAFWAPLLIGIGLFASYFLAAHSYSQRHRLPIDTSGVNEGLKNLYPQTLAQVRAALMLPTYLLLYSMPVSLALPFWFSSRPIRGAMDGPRRDRSAAIAAAVPAAWVICLLSGMTNPRYGYPSLPLLCPLAGAVAVAAARLGGGPAEWVRRTAAVAGFALAGVALFLTFSAWKLSHAGILIPGISADLAVIAAIVVAVRISRSWTAAWWLVPIVVLASVPFGIRQSRARTPISGLYTARYINQIAGPHPRIMEGMGLTFKPEIFYYAQARATAVIPKVFDPAYIHPGTWVYMDNHEHDRWKREAGDLLNHDMLINPNPKGESKYYFAWYGPKDDPAARLADNAPAVAPTARGR
jgi:4-amino-4-deoxy-L-arabinose transferase-like glycosyltransferase